MSLHPLREATAFVLDAALVESCLDPTNAVDVAFREAFRNSLASVPRAARPAALNGVTGHVAESVLELVLTDLGYTPIWHFAGPGQHGIDLAMLAPTMDRVVVFEVKGTLRPRRLPGLSRGDLAQLSAGWIDKQDNPGMHSLELTSTDVYGGMAIVQFADRSYKLGLSRDFDALVPVTANSQLLELDWLDDPAMVSRASKAPAANVSGAR